MPVTIDGDSRPDSRQALTLSSPTKSRPTLLVMAARSCVKRASTDYGTVLISCASRMRTFACQDD